MAASLVPSCSHVGLFVNNGSPIPQTESTPALYQLDLSLRHILALAPPFIRGAGGVECDLEKANWYYSNSKRSLSQVLVVQQYSRLGSFMKHLALAATVALGWAALAAPANAALFSWDIEYTGWWEDDGGGSIFGTIIADEDDAADGIVSANELKAWEWNWSGNDVVSAFSIFSKDKGATTDFEPSFYVNGTPNQPIGLDFVDPDNLDQGSFVSGSGNEILDLQALLAISFTDGVESVSVGNPTATIGSVTVSEPTAVPEPATVLGLLALAGISTATLKRQKQDA
jgi:hypothetical protein